MFAALFGITRHESLQRWYIQTHGGFNSGTVTQFNPNLVWFQTKVFKHFPRQTFVDRLGVLTLHPRSAPPLILSHNAKRRRLSAGACMKFKETLNAGTDYVRRSECSLSPSRLTSAAAVTEEVASQLGSDK